MPHRVLPRVRQVLHDPGLLRGKVSEPVALVKLASFGVGCTDVIGFICCEFPGARCPCTVVLPPFLFGPGRSVLFDGNLYIPSV